MIEFVRAASEDHLFGVSVAVGNGLFAIGSAAAALVLGIDVPDGVIVALFAASISFMAWIVTMIMKVVADQRVTAVLIAEIRKDVDHLEDRLEG